MVRPERDFRLESNWPFWPFVLAAVWGLLSMVFFTQALDGAERNRARALTQTIIVILLLGRLLLARWRRERNGTWMGYMTGMIVAAPLWLIIEGGIRALWDR